MASAELEHRWSAWLLEQNRRGTRAALSIALFLYPLFGVLDYLLAPARWLWLLYTTRVTVVLLPTPVVVTTHAAIIASLLAPLAGAMKGVISCCR